MDKIEEIIDAVLVYTALMCMALVPVYLIALFVARLME